MISLSVGGWEVREIVRDSCLWRLVVAGYAARVNVVGSYTYSVRTCMQSILIFWISKLKGKIQCNYIISIIPGKKRSGYET